MHRRLAMVDSSFRRMGDVRTALVCGGVALLAAVLLIVHVAALALLLAFAGALAGLSIRGLAEWIAARLHCRVGWALLGCIGVALVIGVVAISWIVPRVDAHLGAVADQVAAAYHQVRARLAQTEIGARLGGGALGLDEPLRYASRAVGVLASVVSALGAALVVGFVALHVAVDPDIYRCGVLRLVPRAGRERGGEVLAALSCTLRRWMLGRILSMTAVGVATTAGLMLLGVPLPVTLGILAGVLGFIPNVGPIVASIPALLLAATIDLAHVGYVAALYLGINVADGYGLTPLIEKRAVSTPAALVIVGQLVFGAAWGIVGLMLATPLLACALVIVRMLYVEDVIERAPANG